MLIPLLIGVHFHCAVESTMGLVTPQFDDGLCIASRVEDKIQTNHSRCMTCLRHMCHPESTCRTLRLKFNVSMLASIRETRQKKIHPYRPYHISFCIFLHLIISDPHGMIVNHGVKLGTWRTWRTWIGSFHGKSGTPPR